MKRFLSLLLAIAIVVGMLPTMAFAAEGEPQSGSWYDAAATELTISTAAELQEFALITQGNHATIAKDNFKGKTVKLGDNINLSGSPWYNRDTESNVTADYRIVDFAGTFDGNNKTISNISLQNAYDSGSSVGLCFFRNVTGVIKNLTLDGIDADSVGNASAYVVNYIQTSNAGKPAAANLKNVHVKNFDVSIDNDECAADTNSQVAGLVRWAGKGLWAKDCSVTNLNATVTGKAIAGGFSAYVAQTSEFYNCDVTNVTINLGSVYAGFGGFAGQVQSSSYVQRVFNDCDVTNANLTVGYLDAMVGGFLGNLGGMVNCDDCDVTGKITITSDVENAHAGGFVGDLGWQGDWSNDKIGHTFDNCTADVDITAVNSDVGGFVGMSAIVDDAVLDQDEAMSAVFNNCSASGDVTTVNGAAGGFVGSGDRGEYADCKATGAVKGDIAGGFWGEVFSMPAAPSNGNTGKGENFTGVVIKEATASTSVTGTTHTAGLVGYVDNKDNAEDGYQTPVSFENNTYTGTMYNASENAGGLPENVVPAEPVATIGNQTFETLAAAIANATAGDTITLLADVTENVTIDKSVTIDGADKTYTGQMKLTNGANITIKNVNFDGKGYNGYAVETRGANYLTIEDCTAKNYGYGFVQLASGTALTTVKNVTVSDMAYGVKVDYSNAVVLENVDITASVAGVLNSNYGEKTITIKNSDINILGTWTRDNTTKTTYVFEGANSINKFVIDAAIDNFKLAEGATLTAPNDITVTTDAADYEVEYKDGKYVAVEKAYAAKIGDVKYATLKAAVEAANGMENATIVLASDVTLGVKLTITGNVTILGNTESANIGGMGQIGALGGAVAKTGPYTITRDAAYTGTLFEVQAGATLTLDDKLTIDGGNEWTLNTELYNKALNREVTGVTWADLITSEEGAPNATAAMFVVNGTVVANKVTIQNNYSTKDSNGGDGGVFKVEANATLTMTGATVKHIVTGGANSVAHLSTNAVWTINEGTLITDAFAARNGGVCRNDNGKIVMNGGTIEKNNSINTNGSVFMLYQGTLEMKGGKICSNTGISGADNSRCSAIYLHNSGKMIMSGGEICHNEGGYGGIDTKQTNSELTITGGSVVNNVSHGTNNTPDIKWSDGNSNASITGGTFTQDVSAWLDPAYGLKYNAETGTYGVTNNPADGKVAKAGDKYYKTLAEAIAAGGEVTLLADIELAEPIKVNGVVTLNLNGKTITGTDNATGSFGLINMQPGSDLTIKGDGKITLTATNDRDWSAYSSVISNQRGKLTVESGTIEHLGGTDMAYAIDNLTNGKGTYAETVINDGTIKSTYRAIRQFLNGVEAQNILTVNGGTIEGTNRSIWMQDPNKNANTGTLTVGKNATLNGDVYLYVTEGSTEWPVQVAIAEAALAEGSEIVTGNVPEGYELQTVNGTIGVVKAVVEMNGVVYSSIYDALDAVQPRETATIKILKDFTITADQRMFSNYSVVINAEYITLDLNGKTITFDYEGSTATCYAAFAIYNKGTLTIIDSSEEKTGTIYNKTKIQGTDGPRILWVTSAGSASLEGGNYISEQGDTMFYCSNSNMEIPTTLYIKDGYYEHTIPTSGENYRYFNIQDGGGQEIIEVSGGTFAHNPTDFEMRFPEGFVADENADGSWGVVAKKVAKIGNVEYATLQEAVNAAKHAQTITLLGDAEGPGVVIDKKDMNIVIDFDGHTYTLTEPVGSKGTESNGFQILSGAKLITLTNGTLKVADSAADKFYILIQNYANLTVRGMTLDGTNLDKWSKTDGDSYVLSNNSGKVTINSTTTKPAIVTNIITNNDGDKAFAFDSCDKSDWGYSLPTVTAVSSVTINSVKVAQAGDKIEAAAKVGTVYYATLQQAINAAKTNETVTLMKNIKVDAADAVKTSDNLAVMFAVEGKSLTLDMNGKTISVDHKSTTDRIYAVIYVADGASLTVKGEGGIDVVTDANTPKVAYLFWKRGTTGTLTIEDGTYHMNNSEDSMVYTNGNDIVNIKGGIWTLDAVNTRVNGFPCILNASGSNTQNINVSGGTYNYNVAKQYWAHEVDIVDAKGNLSYVVDNGDGTWTVTGLTAEVAIMADMQGNYDYPIGYATFKDAIAAIAKGAGETTIKLQKNITVKGQFIGHSYAQKVVIDLNGKTMSSTDKTLTVYRSGTEVTIKNGTVSGNTTGGTIQVTYGGKLTLGEDVTVKSGGQATAIKVDANSTLIVDKDTTYVLGGKNDLVVAEGAKVEISAGNFKKPVDAAWCAAGYMPNPEKTSEGYYTVKYCGVALVGNQGYETLKKAIQAAQSGDTIKLMQNIEVTAEDAVNFDGHKSVFVIDGKTITLDMNGKTISGDFEGLEGMLVGIITTANDAHLTIKGDGALTGAANGANVYALIVNYNPDCSIVIENGTFTLDEASDCLIYSAATTNEGEVNAEVKRTGVIVKNGEFVLGNLGTGANNSPWIFNASGRNQRHIWVEGGSFNADVNHQYWIHEVQMPGEKALVKGEDGMWTVVPAAAYVIEIHNTYKHYVGYATIEKALAKAGNWEVVVIGVQSATTPDDLMSAVGNTNGENNTVVMGGDMNIAKNTEFLMEAPSSITFVGNGNTITANGNTTTSAPGTDDYGYVGFVPANGEDATVSNVTVAGAGFVEVGHYGVSTGGNYAITNLTVKDLVATLAVNNGGNNIAAAFSHYGNATLTNCVMTGTTTEKEGFKPYDAAFVNGTKTTINGGKYGKVYLAHQAHVTITGAEIAEIDSCAITTRNLGKLTIGAGAKIGTIYLTPGSYTPSIVIEEGAEIGAIVYNGVTYTMTEWLAR